MSDEALKIADALLAANIPYAGFSCNGVNLFGDSKSIDALRSWHHGAGTVPQLKQMIAEARQTTNEVEARRRHLEDVSCRQQNEIASLKTRVGNLWSALDRVKHGAEYEDELGEIIDRALSLQDHGWQDISTAPKDSKDLLLCVAGFSPLTGHWNASKGHWVSHPNHTSYRPTHWCPCPAAPHSMVAEQQTEAK